MIDDDLVANVDLVELEDLVDLEDLIVDLMVVFSFRVESSDGNF